MANGLHPRSFGRTLARGADYSNMPESSYPSRQRISKTVRPFYPVEVLLNDQVQDLRKKNVPVDQWVLKILAKQIYHFLEIENGPLAFRLPHFSSSWVSSFKKFWGYSFHTTKGEAGSVDWALIVAQVEEIKAVITEYELEDVYNADETGLLLQSTTNWTVDTERRPGTKSSSTRVSVLFCTNATGTDKRPPLMLSQSLPVGFAKSAVMKSFVDVASPSTSRSKGKERAGQPQATPTSGPRADYMNYRIFLEWLQGLQASVVKKDPSRKILLLLDNASCHTVAARSTDDFPNIRILPLPPNSTSVTQPLDAGIIAVFKKKYRDMLLQILISKYIKASVSPPLTSATRKDESVNTIHEGTASVLPNPFLVASTSADLSSSDGTPTNSASLERQHLRQTTSPSTITKKPKPIKVSNQEAWHIFVEAWDAVTPSSIKSCFRHVPIISVAQKQMLSVSDEIHPDVQAALAAVQDNAVQQMRKQGFNEFMGNTSNNTSSRTSIDTNAGQHIASTSETTASQLLLLKDVSKIDGTHMKLLASLDNILDGSPILASAMERYKDDATFLSYFRNTPLVTDALLDDWMDSTSEGDDSQNEEYTPGHRPLLVGLGDKGSPLRPKVHWKTLHRRRYKSVVEQLLSSECDDTSTTEVAQSETSDSGAESFISGDVELSKEEQDTRNQVTRLLSVVTDLMKPYPKFSSHRKRVEVISDVLIGKDYMEASVEYRNNFVREKLQLSSDYQEQKKRKTEQRERTIHKLNQRFPNTEGSRRVKN